MTDAMRQQAPFPHELDSLVTQLTYRPGWEFHLGHLDRGQGSEGLTLDIVTLGYDAYHPERGETYRVHHYFPVPPAAFNRRSWQWWLFQQLLSVEQHEAMEFFVIDGERPFAPLHGPGNDPYLITVESSSAERRTSFRGELTQRFMLRLDDGLWSCAGCGRVLDGAELKHRPDCPEVTSA